MASGDAGERLELAATRPCKIVGQCRRGTQQLKAAVGPVFWQRRRSRQQQLDLREHVLQRVYRSAIRHTSTVRCQPPVRQPPTNATFRHYGLASISGGPNRVIPARTNDRMIGPPRSFKVALDCGESEAKGQASTEGFCRASARHRWRVDRATPRRLAPSRTEMPFTASSFPTGTGSDGRPRRFPCARARSRPAIVRSFRRSRSN